MQRLILWMVTGDKEDAQLQIYEDAQRSSEPGAAPKAPRAPFVRTVEYPGLFPKGGDATCMPK